MNKIEHVAPILVRSIQNGPTIAWPKRAYLGTRPGDLTGTGPGQSSKAL
ncbi:hypothetical protein HF313_05020 [Massilia atriviolacea]|nr:hypothetical protein [Massilia atriviolacea]